MMDNAPTLMPAAPPAVAKKRRLSVGKQRTSDAAPPPVVPLEQNDDAAEKAARRKADKESVENGALLQGKKVAAVKAPTQTDKLDNKKLADMYSMCLSLSTMNKITPQNAFQLNLIDHIDDVIEADEAANKDSLVSTNFHKASSTVETSVKIYSYRVDAVHTDAFKILGGLTRNEDGKGEQRDDDDDNDEAGARNGDDDGGAQLDEDGNPIAAVVKPSAKRRLGRNAGAATLESNLDNLNVKKVDDDFDVDPLFRATAAQFDQGGCRGLLLNHLRVVDQSTLLFDSQRCVVPPLGADGAIVHWRAAGAPSPTATATATATTSEMNAAADVEADAFVEALVADALPVDVVRRVRICPSLSRWTWQRDEKSSTTAATANASKNKSNNGTLDEDEDEGIAVRMARGVGAVNTSAFDDIEIDLGDDLDGSRLQANDARDDNANDERRDNDAIDAADERVVQAELERDTFAQLLDAQDGGDFGADNGASPHDDDDDGDGGDDERGGAVRALKLHGEPRARLSLHQLPQDQDSIAAGIAASALAAGKATAPLVVDSLASAAGVALLVGSEAQQNEFQFFDASLLRGWAGPSHWKFGASSATARRNAAIAAASALGVDVNSAKNASTAAVDDRDDGDDDENDGVDGQTGDGKKKRRAPAKKKDAHIDFRVAPTIDVAAAMLPAKAGTTTLTVAAAKKAAESAVTMLPPDLHFELRSLTQLFNRPQWSVLNQKRQRCLPPSAANQGDAHAAANDAAALLADAGFANYDDNNNDNNDDDDDDHHEGGALNNDNDGGFDNVGGGFDGDEHVGASSERNAARAALLNDDGLPLVASPQKAQRIAIDFERRAKRIDVKLLKKSIWQELAPTTTTTTTTNDSAQQQLNGESTGAAVANDVATGGQRGGIVAERNFRDVLQSIPQRVDANAVGEVSVPLAFICLLHLCNEKDLELINTSDSFLAVRSRQS